MGQVKDNLLTKGFSGKIGDEIVFRQVKKRTIFAKRQGKRQTITPNQAAYQTKFKKAVYYAKSVLLDPIVHAEYAAVAKEADMRGAFNVAVTDYLKDPAIASIFADNYKGVMGNLIYIATVDNFKIKTVTVTITGANSLVIETGDAMADQGQWAYTAQNANPVVKGSTISVVAKDRLGKTATLDLVL